jgi:predicted ester cyclase
MRSVGGMQLADSPALTAAHDYLDAWNARDGERVMRAFVAGGTYSDPAAGTLSGSAIGGYVAALGESFPDLHFDVERVLPTGEDTVIVTWVMQGTQHGPLAGRLPTGRSIALPGLDVITTIADGEVRSVRGYFDQKLFFEQLGFQVLVAPQSDSRVRYGVAAYARSGRCTRPAAFTTTWIDVRDEQEQQLVVESSRRVVAEAAPDAGFISWLGVIVDGRLFTATAWENLESMQRVMRGPAHLQGMELATRHGVGTAMHTSAWVVGHQNPLYVRCLSCGTLVQHAAPLGQCRCGAELPPAPPFW